MSSCFIEGKGLLPQNQNDDHCETQHQVTMGAGHDNRKDWAHYDTSERPFWVTNEGAQSKDDLGFRLVKNFELRAEPEEKKTGNVIE